MSLLKQLDRAARTAFCPSARYPSLLASGTIAGTIDDSFVTKSSLEIYDLNLGGSGNDMRLLGSIESKDCFHSVAWGAKGMEEGGGMSHGLVAGGMSDGSINIWNVDAILQHAPAEQALLSRSEVHKGQVLGLQFHPQQPNLLASGATDGEVYVWDLANLRAPVPNKPNPTLKSAQLSGITSLAWNKSAPQILASASEAGETTVWDLRQKRSIITIRNSARMNVRTSGLAWNPAAGVQLAVCYSNYPVAEIWDLRQSMTPKVKLEGYHQGSILSLDWCPNDPSILLTVGEDTKMHSWNPLTGQHLHEYYNPSSNVAFDVQWSPKQPNIVTTSSYDGKVSVLSIDTTGPAHVPAWMTRPIGANFGFGGKLVTFGLDAPPPVAPTVPTGGPATPHKAYHPRVQVAQLVTDPEVLDKAQGLQQILKEGDFPAFCAYKITNSGSDADEQTIWTFMKILFEDGANQRYLLLKELGFEPPATSDIVMPQPSVPVVPNISEADFFNQEFTPAAGESSPLDSNGALADAVDAVAEGKDGESPSGAASPAAGPYVESADDLAIRQALVFGDFKAAVAKCLAVGRMADAIIFASFGPPPLWEETRAKYFEMNRMPFIRDVMKNVSNQSLDEMVQQSQLASWKETLAICITYTTTNKYRELVNQLAARLEAANSNIPAVVCYICSSNIDKAIEMWTNKIPAHQAGGEGGSALLALHAAIEKIAVFAHATNALQGAGQAAPSKVLSLKYAEYASMLASQGELRGAFNYLSRVATPNDPNSAVLLDRIFHAESEQFVREQYAVPAFPFPLERVDADPTLAQQLHAQAVAKQQRQQAAAQQQAMLAQRSAQNAGQQFGQQQQHPQQHQPQQQRPPQGQQQYGQANGAQQHYGAPQQQVPQQQQYNQYGQPVPQQQQGGQYGVPQPAPSQYAPQPTPNGQYAQPQHQQRPPFQPQQPSYAPAPAPVPQQPIQQQYPPQGGFNQPPAQPAHTPYGQPPPQQHQPYGAPPAQQQQHFTPAPAAHVPQAMPAAPVSNAPYTPAPSTFVPASSPYGAAAPSPAAAAPKPYTPTVPTNLAPASSPIAAAAPAVAQPDAAPVNLSPADQSLINPLEQCLSALSGVGLKLPEQKKVTEIRGKLSELARKLANHELSPTASQELQHLAQAVAANDFTAAQKHHLNLVKTDWANNNEWLVSLKTMLLMAKKYLEKTG